MSGGGGGGSQTATNYTSNVPEYAKGAFMDLVGKANALTNAPQQQYTGDRQAQFTPLQQQAFDSTANLGPTAATQQGANMAGLAALKGMTTNYGPNGFSLAGGPQQVSATSASGGGGYSNVNVPGQDVLQNVQGPGGPMQTGTQSFTQPGTAQSYMNPYTQNVVNIQQREAIRADDIARQSRNARAVQSGAFGGSRQAIMEAEAGRNLQTQLGDIQAQGLDKAYQQAQQQFNTEQSLGFQSQQANQRAGIDTSQMGLQAALANQRGALDLSQQQLQAQQANQRAGIDSAGQSLQASLANQRAALDAGIANQRAGMEFNNQYLEAQRAGEQSRQFGANLGLEGTRTGLQAAQTLGQLGDAQFGQQREAINMQYGMGNQQQQQVQRILDQQYGDFQAQRDYPYQQIGFMSDLLRGAGGSTRQVYPGPSTMQTLAGLGTAAYGLKSMGGMKAGGTVKAGLADIAPDMGDYADGGVVGYAGGGATEEPADPYALPRAKAEPGFVDRMKLAGLQMWLQAPQMQATMALERQMFGSGKKPAPKASPAAPASQEVVVPDAAPNAQQPAGGGAAGIAALSKATMAGAGPKGLSLQEAQQRLAGADAQADANVKALTAARSALLAKDEAAADQGIAQFDKDTAERGMYGVDREARAKEGLAALDERKGKVKGEALLQAGLAILSADPRRGGWSAIGEGLGVGLKQYRGDLRDLAADKDRLDEKLSQINDMRRAESTADKRERRAMVAERSKLSAEAAKDLMRIQADFGLKPKYETAVKAVDMSFRSEEAYKERAAAAERSNADNASRAGIAQLYGPRGGKGTGAVLKPGTPQYEAAVAKATATYIKEGVTGPDGKMLMGPAAVKQARLLAEAAVRQGMTPELESADTAGPGASQGWQIQR